MWCGGKIISSNKLIDCFWRNNIYCKNALLLLAWPDREATFVAHKQLIVTFVEMQTSAYRSVVDFTRALAGML
jgi:hypothetical protein